MVDNLKEVMFSKRILLKENKDFKSDLKTRWWEKLEMNLPWKATRLYWDTWQAGEDEAA